MAWRETFLVHFGPGLLGGITLGDWLKLLREQRFAISPSCLTRAISITVQSVRNSVLRKREEARFRAGLEDAVIQPPLFVLGHWRNGTTHLHNLLAIDRRFAFPNNYQVSFPHIFLSSEERSTRWLRFLLPPQRPMDNIRWNLASPQEDEFALSATCVKSPCMGWVFPRRQQCFDKYLTMRAVSEEEIADWRAALTRFLKKLTLKYARPIVLKSPPHTCRIRLLLELFPEARFVHIHRNPYDVFQSSRWMFKVTSRWHRLQRPCRGLKAERRFDNWVLRQYQEMYEAYFEERSLVPKGHHCEICFEELEQDPVGQIRRVYETLGLPQFEIVQPDLEEYVASVAGYRKNSFPMLPDELRSRIAHEWRVCFEEWGYPLK